MQRDLQIYSRLQRGAKSFKKIKENMEIQQRIIKFIVRSNWFIFIVGSLLAFINTPFKFAMGILLGGLIVTVNFHLLKSSLKKILDPLRTEWNKKNILRAILTKYYIRFILSGMVIFLLIFGNIVNPLGLVVGLSVVVVSITAATMLEITRLFIKEEV